MSVAMFMSFAPFFNLLRIFGCESNLLQLSHLSSQLRIICQEKLLVSACVGDVVPLGRMVNSLRDGF